MGLRDKRTSLVGVQGVELHLHCCGPVRVTQDKPSGEPTRSRRQRGWPGDGSAGRSRVGRSSGELDGEEGSYEDNLHH